MHSILLLHRRTVPAGGRLRTTTEQTRSEHPPGPPPGGSLPVCFCTTAACLPASAGGSLYLLLQHDVLRLDRRSVRMCLLQVLRRERASAALARNANRDIGNMESPRSDPSSMGESFFSPCPRSDPSSMGESFFSPCTRHVSMYLRPGIVIHSFCRSVPRGIIFY